MTSLQYIAYILQLVRVNDNIEQDLQVRQTIRLILPGKDSIPRPKRHHEGCYLGNHGSTMLHFDQSATHLQRQVKLLSNTAGCFFTELVSCQSRLHQQQKLACNKGETKQHCTNARENLWGEGLVQNGTSKHALLTWKTGGTMSSLVQRSVAAKLRMQTTAGSEHPVWL